MKCVNALLVTLLLSVSVLLAQDAKPETKSADDSISRDFRSRVFIVENRDPHNLAAAIKLLGSGAKGADLSVNDALHTITVRDYPENIAAMADALRRLDQPASPEPAIALQMWVLVGSKLPVGSLKVPQELASVVKSLSGSLVFSYYGLISSTEYRTTAGENIEGSGIVEPYALGLSAKARGPMFFDYTLRRLTTTAGEKPGVAIEHFRFVLHYPMPQGSNLRTRDVGFNLPISIPAGEKRVIGTHLGDKALILVVSASVVP